MVNKNDYIRTIQSGDRVGPLINKIHYEEIKDFFLQTLEEQTALSISTLLEKGKERFNHLFKDETGWYLYNVKLDLEARGMIRQLFPDKRNKRPMIGKMENTSEQIQSHSIEQRNHLTTSVHNKFIDLFNSDPLMVYAPGRINLIGEHTDYNDGFVMPAAIDKGIQFAIGASKGESLIYSIKYKQFLSIDLKNIRPVKKPDWHNYLLGVLHQLQARGHKIKPFNCVFEGDLPTGAGLSSSAAMECGFTMALDTLFDLKLDKMEIVEIAQWSEHNFVGVKCGIMDQFASVMGKENHVIQLDCRSREFEYHPLDLGQHCILLCDTNVKHSLASSEYNTRREECEKGVTLIRHFFPEVQSLRDVTPSMLAGARDLMPRTIYNRCKYIIEENMRVIAAGKDLRSGNIRQLGEKLFQSHAGLSELYEVSCAELDFMVDFARKSEGVSGSRMMGGGFGGCTLNIIHNTMVGSFITQAKAAYRKHFNKELTCHLIRISKGTHVIKTPQDSI